MLRRLFTALAVSISASAVLMGIGAPQAHAATLLGGINFNAYCKAAYGSQSYTMLFENSPYLWTCYRPVYRDYRVPSYNAACMWQYNNQGAYAKVLDSRNPYSVKCYRF